MSERFSHSPLSLAKRFENRLNNTAQRLVAPIDRLMSKLDYKEAVPDCIPQAIVDMDKSIFGHAEYSPTAEAYYDNILAAIVRTLPSETPQETIKTVRRPGGLSTANFDSDLEESSSLPENQCFVAYGHGSLAVVPYYNPSDRILRKGGRIAYHDHAASNFTQADYRGISGKSLKRLLNMDPIDITLNSTANAQEQTNNLREITRKSLRYVLDQVDGGMFSGVNITRASDMTEHLLMSHMQCGAQGGSMYKTFQEFIEYANQAATLPSKGRLIPAIELMEGLIISLDVGQLKKGVAAIKFYDHDRFEKHLKDYGLSIGGQSTCVDDRTPFSSTTGHITDLARRAASYNRLRKNHNPVYEHERETGQLLDTHHTSIIALCDGDEPNDRKLAHTLTHSTQMMCNACVQGFHPQYLGNQQPLQESLSNTPASLVYLTSAEETQNYLDKLGAVYHVAGSGSAKEFGAMSWEGSHPHTLRSVTGTVIGGGESLSETTLVRPPADNSSINGPLLLVTESIVKSAGGPDEFLKKIHASDGQVFYAAIAVIDSHTGNYQLVGVNINPEQHTQSEKVQWHGGFFHPDWPLAIHNPYRQQEGLLANSSAEVQLIGKDGQRRKNVKWPWSISGSISND